MGHKLYIDVQDGANDNKYIMVKDLSAWDDVLAIKDRILQVLPPYLDKYIKVPFPQNTEIGMNSINLGLSTTVDDLPDGPYKIHYSVAPNTMVYIEYVHYRIAVLMNKVLGKMALLSVEPDISLDSCGNIEMNKQETALTYIWMLLQGAQSVGRCSHDIPEADELYKQAMRCYDRLFDINCVHC